MECAYCKIIYKLPGALAAHITKYHSSVAPALTPLASQMHTKAIANSHSSAESPATCLNCSHCGKAYSSAASLRYHQYTHATAALFKCDVADCDMAFKSPKLLSAHKRSRHVQSPRFLCEFCGYCTHIRCNLHVHKRTHTGVKPYCCELCDKRFASRYQVCAHKSTHSTQRPNKCDVCGVAFASRKTLTHHKVLHLQQKKYVCECCGKAFAQAAGISQHMRMHRERNRRTTATIMIQKLLT